jgi:hypothetical protein
MGTAISFDDDSDQLERPPIETGTTAHRCLDALSSKSRWPVIETDRGTLPCRARGLLDLDARSSRLRSLLATLTKPAAPGRSLRAYLSTCSAAEAKDLVQDAFLRLCGRSM